MESIDPNLDLGNGLTIRAFLALIQDTQSKLDAYNTLLSTLDQITLALKADEQSVSELSERMLTGVASKYGRYSTEYVAGGSPRSTRRRSSANQFSSEVAAVSSTAMQPMRNPVQHRMNGSVNEIAVN